jgi:hypothetical protein
MAADSSSEVQALHPDHAPHAVDVDRRCAEQGLEDEGVEHPAGGVTEEDPRCRVEDPGDDERHQRRREEQSLERRVRADLDIGERGAEHEGKRGRTDGEPQ